MSKSIIEQMPEVVRGLMETERAYMEVLNKSIDSCNASAASCFQTGDYLIKALSDEASKASDFEEKKFYYEEAIGIFDKKYQKDTEHRDTIITMQNNCGKIVIAGIIVMACLFIGKASIKI